MAYTVQKKRKVSLRELAHDQAPVTFEKFYALAEESKKYDLIDGKVIRDAPLPHHSLVVSWLIALLKLYVEQLDLGEIMGAPVTVRLSTYQGPEPDVLFISKSRLGIIVEKYIDGPPDLCIEVISRSTRRLDRGRKFVLYAEYGVKEYWIIDPFRDEVEFFENVNGEWRIIQPDEKQRLHSNALRDFWLKPEWVSARNLPPVLATLKEILGEQKAELEV